MPDSSICWYHVMLGTYGSWLPDDPRGFRSRRHKIHSSGDYRQPPPAGEHVGLRRYCREISGPVVQIPVAARGVAGSALVARLARRRLRIVALAVGARHAHLLVELPRRREVQSDLLGQCKSASSHAIRRTVPGRVWPAGWQLVPIHDRRQQWQTFHYIVAHARQGAWVWTWRDGTPGGPRENPEAHDPGVSRTQPRA
jgi:hypothetical protein